MSDNHESPSEVDDENTAEEGTSSTNKARLTALLGDCLICGHTAHGTHFGVLSCRACAAFYRRSVVLGKHYKCRRGGEKCEIGKEARYLCRRCRFLKCTLLGMCADTTYCWHPTESGVFFVCNAAHKDVQRNRDRISSTVGRENDRPRFRSPLNAQWRQANDESTGDEDDMHGSSMDLATGQDACTSGPSAPQRTGHVPQGLPARQSLLEPLPFSAIRFASKNAVAPMHLDLSETTRNIETVMSTFTPTLDPSLHLNTLQRLVVALHRMRRDQSSNPQQMQELRIDAIRPLWEKQLKGIAEFMLHSEEFAALQIADKMSIFKMCWCAIQRLERAAMSVELFGEEIYRSRRFVVFDNYSLSDCTKINAESVSDYSSENLKKMFLPFVDRILSEVVRPMINLKITHFELVYMISQLMWHLEGRRLEEFANAALLPLPTNDWKDVSESALAAAERFRERICNDLHDYYVNSMQTPNYAGRLMKLMAIVHSIEQIQSDRAKVFELARIFDVFKLDCNEKEGNLKYQC